MSDVTPSLVGRMQIKPNLRDCERAIERAAVAYAQAGTALAMIRDQGLYKDQHSSFEDYCRERWGLSRQHAYRQIDAAKVYETIADRSELSPRGDIPAPPRNEKIARALVPLRSKPAQLTKVWQKVVEQHGGELEDETYKERLADMFGERFKMGRLEVAQGGEESVAPTAPRRSGEGAGKRSKATSHGDSSEPQIGQREGDSSAKKVKPAVSLPRWDRCEPDDLEVGMIAFWDPRNPDGPTVQINVDHPVIRDQVKHWTEHYPHEPEVVQGTVEEIYGQCAIVAVAHSEQLKTLNVDRRTLEDDVRSDKALTLAMLGLMPHDQLISQRLSAKLGKRRGG